MSQARPGSAKTRSERQAAGELETKDLLLEVAIDLFATKGYAGTSIRDIADAMGMSISNIYHYYGSKEGILLAICEQSADRLLENLRRVVELDIDPLARFNLLIKTNLSLTGRFRNEARVYTIEKEQFPPEARKRTVHVQREILAIYHEQLRILSERGLLLPADLKILTFNVLGVVNWLLRWYREDGPLTLDQVSDQIVSFVLRATLKPEVVAQLESKAGG